ncbi:Protein of unknown function [Singulisphaera sp. GP187]|uniref:DUF1570 domain-containing protein n=1 Tax=Singulisphaera sp. GP187 TaxID=1882752 RepID=UPI000929B9E6|nr:DUF1570 domain-containing protein [Singulisphaera sp. GP187]SIN83453.1 Protein of unknown function [Singulisphaera sp. GP187]
MLVLSCSLGLLLTLQVPPPDLADQPAANLRQAVQTIRAQETAELDRLATRLTQQGQPSAAKAVRSKIEPIPPADGATRFVLLSKVESTTVNGLANVAAKPNDANAWNGELRAIQEKTASALFELAERAVSSNPTHYALADACLRGVLSRQPNHPEARRLLGYIPHEKGWATPFASSQLRKGMVDHPTFGWVQSSWVPHLEKGELPAPPTRGQANVRWLPAEQADQLHSPWKSGWRISTEHFRIQTNVPFSQAIAFGRQLEAFHDLFFSLLADVIETDSRLPLAQRFRDKKLVGEKNSNNDPHQVYYFKTKQEYVDYLIPYEPKIEGSLGIYIPPKSGKGKRAPAYFFHDPEAEINATATLFHEVSHQLLFETAGRNGYNKNVGNYWVFEGLGTYFETVVAGSDGVLMVGGVAGPRIDAARAQMERGAFLPIEQLLQLDQAAFNAEASIHLHYAESMALAVFLMQGREQAYREPFLDYAKDAYRGILRRDTGRSLQERLGVSYEDLNQEFLEFLKRG